MQLKGLVGVRVRESRENSPPLRTVKLGTKLPRRHTHKWCLQQPLNVGEAGILVETKFILLFKQKR